MDVGMMAAHMIDVKSNVPKLPQSQSVHGASVVKCQRAARCTERALPHRRCVSACSLTSRATVTGLRFSQSTTCRAVCHAMAGSGDTEFVSSSVF
jgi:hypothetical protein